MDEIAMHRAAYQGDLHSVKQAIEGGMSVDRGDYKGYTPLHHAAAQGHCKVVQLLISSKCDLNLKNRWGRTPVLTAAMRTKKCVVDHLLQCGAQVNCADGNKWTLLHVTAQNGWTDLVHFILGREKTDVNSVTSTGNTPLLEATVRGHEDVSALLIRAGADVNQKWKHKTTPLHFAAYHGYTRVVQVLLESERLDLNPQDSDGRTPLHWVMEVFSTRGGDHRQVVRQLLAAGADPNIKTCAGETVLSHGIRVGKITGRDIRLLVQNGAFIQDCDYELLCRSPLFQRCFMEDVHFCTQSIVNKFHRQSLHTLCRNPYFARNLPCIDNFNLTAQQIDDVGNLVDSEIKRNGFCNVVKAHPMALSALCVLSLLTCQSGTKRSASPDFGESNSPFKNFRLA